jgi:hypothetical protein
MLAHFGKEGIPESERTFTVVSKISREVTIGISTTATFFG